MTTTKEGGGGGGEKEKKGKREGKEKGIISFWIQQEKGCVGSCVSNTKGMTGFWKCLIQIIGPSFSASLDNVLFQESSLGLPHYRDQPKGISAHISLPVNSGEEFPRNSSNVILILTGCDLTTSP